MGCRNSKTAVFASQQNIKVGSAVKVKGSRSRPQLRHGRPAKTFKPTLDNHKGSSITELRCATSEAELPVTCTEEKNAYTICTQFLRASPADSVKPKKELTSDKLLGLVTNVEHSSMLCNYPVHVAIDAMYKFKPRYGLVGYCGSSRLHLAVQEDDVALSKDLIAKGANVNAKSWDGRTPLHYASERTRGVNAVQVAEALLAEGADVNAVRYNGYTPLHVAAMSGRCSTVQALLDNGADVSAVGFEGDTALNFSSWNDAVAIMMAEGADDNRDCEPHNEACTLEYFPRISDRNITRSFGISLLHRYTKNSVTSTTIPF